MGIRLKVLISIFAMLAIYSIYYWGVPACINLNKLSPLLTNYIENEYDQQLKSQVRKYIKEKQEFDWVMNIQNSMQVIE